MKVILHVEEDADENLIYSIEDVQRTPVLLFLSVLFCGLLVYVGWKKGVTSLISILVTCVLIINLLTPMILAGINPILSTMLICVLSTAVTMYFVGGFNRKSSSATIGCVLSLIFAGGLSLLTVKMASLSGFSSEHSLFLYSARPELSFVAIAVSMMILATMGAVMDVAMSMASSLYELKLKAEGISFKSLVSSGLSIGRDMMGTMANTLVLAYVGSSLSSVLLLCTYADSMADIFNRELIAHEILQAVAGSIGIVRSTR